MSAGNSCGLEGTITVDGPFHVNRKLEETGYVQYFYHYPYSRLPIRDIASRNGKGRGKTEPHIEIGAENYLRACYQKNLTPFIESQAQYLFLVTKCSCPDVDSYGEQFVVGYIQRESYCEFRDSDERHRRYALIGDVYVYPFEQAPRTVDIFGKRFAQSPNKGKNLGLTAHREVKEENTQRLLHHFESKENILNACISEMERHEEEERKAGNPYIAYDEECLGGDCLFRDACLRNG